MRKPDPDPSTAAELGALLREHIEQTAVDEVASRARVLSRARSLPPVGRVNRNWWLAIPALGAAAALIVWWRTPSRLSYEVVGSNHADSYVSAPSDRPVVVHFSDETSVQVEPGSRLRVEDTTREGARVLLERGTADVHVVHRPRTRWVFAAGPFDVLVTGTRFDLNWNPNSEVMELRLREGSVEIRTPFASAPVALRGGQTFRSDLHDRSMTTTDSSAPRPVSSAASGVDSPLDLAEAAASALGGSAGMPSAPSPSVPTVAPPSSAKAWSKLIASGEFDTLLAQANERGVASCLQACSAADLGALADAARYTGKGELADQSLHALRARFSRAPQGRAAAFLLGRLREGQGAAKDARAWYDTYLSESPAGPYAAEALAGKMRAVSKTDGRAAARSLAEEYLKRYPSGVHAGTARGILADR